MARLIYAALASLDGYIEDETGAFQWAAPADEEQFAFTNELMRPIGTHLYGRRMYEVMVYLETNDLDSETSRAERDFTELWRSAQKVVYSTSLGEVSSARTRIARDFEDDVRRLKSEETADLSIGGSELAGNAFRAGLVDEAHLFLGPITVGGGKPALPRGHRMNLELLDSRRFASGVVHLHYKVIV